MGKIFISYRRDDTADASGRLYDRLVGQFGKDSVFKDVDTIPLGMDFRQVLSEKVAQCDAMLVMIGRQWLSAVDEHGLRRLDSSVDFVRIEVEAALTRNIPVIPVLVQGAIVPSAQNLPATLAPLSFRQGIALRSDPYFHHDVDLLVTRLTPALGIQTATPFGTTTTQVSNIQGIIVDHRGDGDFTTIGEALKAAKAGDRIVLRPGVYTESISVYVPVELVGDGAPREDIVIVATEDDEDDYETDDEDDNELDDEENSEPNAVTWTAGLDDEPDAVTWYAAGGIIRGLSIRSQNNAIYISGSFSGLTRIVIENCDLSSANSPVYAGGRTELTLRNCFIHESNDNGISLDESAHCIIEDTRITRCDSGISAIDTTQLTLRRNVITKNRKHGVILLGTATCEAEKNDMRDNKVGTWIVAATATLWEEPDQE